MSTTLDAQFLRAVVLMTGFRGGKDMRRTQAALLLIGLRGVDYTAADLPAEITNGNKHLAGAATGSLIAIGLLEVVGRVKSPDPRAKGRKLDVLRIPAPKWSTAKNWLASNGYQAIPVEQQMDLLTA